MSVYDKGLWRRFNNNTDKMIHDAVNEEQLIHKLTQCPSKKKSFFLQIAHKKVQKTGKPYCYSGGIINPVKLDIGHLNLKGLSN